MTARTTTNTATRRGRPLGSGIDDHAALQQLSAMLAGEPRLKPTTAIRQLGITNPSIVRRLREKLKHPASPQQLAAPVQPPPQPSRPAKSRSKSPATDLPKATPKKSAAKPALATTGAPTDEARPTQPPAPPQGDAKRAQAEAMLMAYLQALQNTAPRGPQRDPAPPLPLPDPSARQKSSPASEPPPSAPPGAEQKSADASQARPASQGFQVPFWPPFMQPMRSPSAPAGPAQPALEAMKLSVEVMTAMAKLQTHIYQSAAQQSPMAAVLQGQAFVGQMMLAAFSGMAPFLQQRTPPKK